LHTRRGAPNKGESVVDKVAAERWMRYAAGLDEFELHGSYEREALWVGRLTRVEARWRDEQGQKVTVQLENHARALLPLELENSRGPELLKRDLEAPAIPLSRRVELALAMQRQQEADELLRQLSAEDPFVAAEFFSQLGRQDEALKLYRAAAADKPAMVGWRLLEMDLPDDAEQLFQRARDDADALLGLAAIARRRGDTRTAVALFEQWREAS
jgi:tetratricopeptide (TPR) repeat protein